MHNGNAWLFCRVRFSEIYARDGMKIVYFSIFFAEKLSVACVSPCFMHATA